MSCRSKHRRIKLSKPESLERRIQRWNKRLGKVQGREIRPLNWKVIPKALEQEATS